MYGLNFSCFLHVFDLENVVFFYKLIYSCGDIFGVFFFKIGFMSLRATFLLKCCAFLCFANSLFHQTSFGQRTDNFCPSYLNNDQCNCFVLGFCARANQDRESCPFLCECLQNRIKKFLFVLMFMFFAIFSQQLLWSKIVVILSCLYEVSLFICMYMFNLLIYSC